MKTYPLLILALYVLVNATIPTVDRGEYFFNEASYDSAINYFKKSEQIALKSRDWTSLIDAKIKLAETYRVINNTQMSIAYLDSAYVVIKDHISKPGEELAKALEINGRVLDYNLRQFDNAKVYYDSSLAIRKRLHGEEHMTISENIFLLGRIDFFKGQLDQASEKYLKAVEMKLKLGGDSEISLFDPYQSLGALNRRQLKMDQSLKYYKKAEAIWENNKRPVDHPSYAMMVYGLGNLNIETGMYEDAKQSYRSAVTTFERFFGLGDFRVATAYANIAACYRNQLEFANAEQYYLKADVIYRKALAENHPFLVSSLIDIADMYHLFGYFEESAKYSEQAIQLMEKYQEKKGNRDLALAMMYYATNLADLKRFPEAQKNIKASIEIFETLEEQYLTSQAYTVSARIHHSLNESPSLALKDFQKSISLFGGTTGRNKPLGYNLQSYATFLGDIGDHQKAYAMFEESLYHLDVDTLKDGELKQRNDFANVDHLIEALPGRGTTLLALYEQSNDPKYLVKALNNYSLLTDLYEKVIKESKSERSKLQQVPNLAAYYEKAVECALKLAEKTGDDQYKDKSFAFAEQSKAIVLWQYVHDSRSRKFAGIPEQVTIQERRLKERLSFMENGMDTSAEWKTKYVALRSSYDSMIVALEKNYPAYYNLKYNRPEVDVKALKAQLKPDEAVVEYLVGDSAVYGFVITNTGLEVFELGGGLNDTAMKITTALKTFDSEAFKTNSNEFYDRYFSTIDSSLSKRNVNVITLIPDGAISYIPFEALSKDDKYLINNYTFHYQYSAGLISTYAAIANENSDSDFIGFAPTFGEPGSDEQLAKLDFAGEEVGDITGMLHGKSLVGDEATETNFKKMVKDYGIVHVATHAVMDDRDASRSRLHFSPNDSLEDGKLHAWELFNLQLRASLVTLSACNTGAGQVHKGEGVMSLSRAFAYAGCPSIVTSLWQAQDRSTATLMHSFYEYLSKGMNKSEALRLAKLEYLAHADKVKSFPFFWAGFILVGDDSPLKTKNYWMWGMAALAGVSAITMFVYFRSSRSRSARSR